MSDNKINTGAIFKNKNKTATNHPDYKGSVNANGKDMDVALWLRESKSGIKYFSVMLTEPFGKDYSSVINEQDPAPLTPQKGDLPF